MTFLQMLFHHIDFNFFLFHTLPGLWPGPPSFMGNFFLYTIPINVQVYT